MHEVSIIDMLSISMKENTTAMVSDQTVDSYALLMHGQQKRKEEEADL